MPKIHSYGLTPYDLQKQLTDEIKNVLSPMTFFKPSGDKTEIPIHMQQLPVTNNSDEDDELCAAPYGIVRMTTGSKDEDDEPMSIDFYVLFCIWDNSHDRQGHISLLNIISRLENHFGEKTHLGNFEIKPVFDFALQDADTHPFYYGAIKLSFNVPKTIKESEFA